MRVDAYNQIQNIYGTKKLGKTSSSEKTSASFGDQLVLSSTAKDAATARKALSETPDVREDLVSSIKQRIDDGTYEVDTDDFAEKLLDKYNGLF